MEVKAEAKSMCMGFRVVGTLGSRPQWVIEFELAHVICMRGRSLARISCALMWLANQVAESGSLGGCRVVLRLCLGSQLVETEIGNAGTRASQAVKATIIFSALVLAKWNSRSRHLVVLTCLEATIGLSL